MHILKPTDISNFQFVKLLEMCDFLFIGYTFFGRGLNTKHNLFYFIYKHNETGTEGAISWFEACMIDIPFAMSQITGKTHDAIIEPWFYSRNEHLVDYLFNIFIKEIKPLKDGE